MKYSTVLWLIGGAAIIGAAAYATYRYFSRSKNLHTGAQMHGTHQASPDTEPEVPDMDMEQAHRTAAASIHETHRQAARQLDTMLTEMADDTTKFEKAHEQINSDLDDLLK